MTESEPKSNKKVKKFHFNFVFFVREICDWEDRGRKNECADNLELIVNQIVKFNGKNSE